MKYIIIDDNNQKFAEELCKELKRDKCIENVLKDKPDQNVNSISDMLKKMTDHIFLINAELKLQDTDNRTDYNGIKLLKRLRIHHKILNPIIIYGFSDFSYILQQHPEHLILTALGNKYLQLPFSPNELGSVLQRLRPIRSVEELKGNYQAAVRADFDIKDIDHSFANEYGLELMLRAHQGVTGNHLKIALNKSRLDHLNWLMFQSDFLYDYNYSKGDINASKDLRKKVTEFISGKRSKIICIDDQGDLGWFSFYSHLLCTDIDRYNPLKAITPKADLRRTIENILNEIKGYQPELVLLDLRLYGDVEKNKKIEEISGYKVLQRIKESFPALPVIITSATNKSDNLSALLKAKAFGLWSKPRIEQGNIDIYERYHQLLNIVKNALDFYTYDEEKIPIKADYLINDIDTASIPTGVKNYLRGYDLIVTDTNCWMMGLSSGKSIDEIALLYKNLVLASKVVDKNNFLIIDDIKRELADHLHKIKRGDRTELDKNAIMAGYGMNLLNRIILAETILVYDRHLIDYKIGERFSFLYDIQGNNIIQECYENKFDSQKKQELFTRDYYMIGDENKRNDKLTKLRKKRKVHADDAFVNIIYQCLTTERGKKSKILFISQDVDCRDNLYAVLCNKFTLVGDPDKKRKNDVEKVISGTFTGVKSDENFCITLVDPFDFSDKLNNS